MLTSIHIIFAESRRTISDVELSCKYQTEKKINDFIIQDSLYAG